LSSSRNNFILAAIVVVIVGAVAGYVYVSSMPSAAAADLADAVSAYFDSDYQAAVELSTRAIGSGSLLYHEEMEAYRIRGEALHKIGENDRALEDLSVVTGQYDRVLENVGRAKREGMSHDEALSVQKSLSTLKLAFMARSRIYEATGMQAEAIADIQAVNSLPNLQID